MSSIRPVVSVRQVWLVAMLAPALLLASGMAMAQSLPISVTTDGDKAHLVIDRPSTISLATQSLLPGPDQAVSALADVSLDFESVQSLLPLSLGARVEVVDPNDPALLARLPDPELTRLSPALPLMVTIEPPLLGGLRFTDIGRIEIHTHALEYSLGSSYRLLKAPIGGQFRDITNEIAQGSVRARGSYGGFSQFLIVTDVRPTSQVVARKIGWLRGQVAALPVSEQGAFSAQLDRIEEAVAGGDYANAIGTIDAFAARARARSGSALDNVWIAGGGGNNEAGLLISGAATLRFSVGYLRDFGE